ncbi:hypothetical protein ACFC7A_19285 [Streptomyces niveus]|uniref:hypothetical protein n=1 Tax=Streptomyces niveus TaxID=193462 RepID=UPI0035D98919
MTIVATSFRFLCAASLLALSWFAPSGLATWLIGGAACALAVSALDHFFSHGRGELTAVATTAAAGGVGFGLLLWATASGAFDAML